MLMLVYALASGFTALWSIVPSIVGELLKAWRNESASELNAVLLVTSSLLLLILITLTKFTVYHVQMVLINSTTIESLENTYNPRYSISVYRNFLQVFGRNTFLWVLPCFWKSGVPVGDGINWPMTGNLSLSSGVNVDSEPNITELSGKNIVFNTSSIWPAEKSEHPRTPIESDTDTSFIRNNPSI